MRNRSCLIWHRLVRFDEQTILSTNAKTLNIPMQLLLNCFPIEIAPEEFPLPTINADSWEASTTVVQQRLRDFRTTRARNDDGSIAIFLIDGPPRPENVGQKLVGGDHFLQV